jgi:hypothetical protein
VQQKHVINYSLQLFSISFESEVGQGFELGTKSRGIKKRRLSLRIFVLQLEINGYSKEEKEIRALKGWKWWDLCRIRWVGDWIKPLCRSTRFCSLLVARRSLINSLNQQSNRPPQLVESIEVAMYDVQQKHVIFFPIILRLTVPYPKYAAEGQQGFWSRDKELVDKEKEIKIKVRIENFVLVWWLMAV